MRRPYKIALFYAVVLLLLIDAYTVSQRFSRPASDEVSWAGVVVAAMLQLCLVGLAAAYAWYLGRAKPISIFPNEILDAIRLRYAPIIAIVVLAGFSVALLDNSVNCGSHPMPSARGQPICPK